MFRKIKMAKKPRIKGLTNGMNAKRSWWKPSFFKWGDKKRIRTRIAPSPTGPLHLGTARSALFNYVFAKAHNAQFILRIEDTDVERSDTIFEEDIKRALEWLGIRWDEYYRQSDRLDFYEKHLKRLLDKGSIFWCPHSEKELADERTFQMQEKKSPRHVCSARDQNLPIKKREGILRFKNNAKDDIFFDDIIRGKIRTRGELLGDFSIAKDLSTPLYNFAVVMDDAESKISHVIRGEDHISNTPKQILIQEALGFSRPIYAHLPLILGSDRSKLSKRDGATAILEYKGRGYLPEAMVNFLILLGWHPESRKVQGSDSEEKEILSADEILKEFSLERVQKAGAIFNLEKLNWINRKYIKKMSIRKLREHLRPFTTKWQDAIQAHPSRWEKIVSLLQPRITTLGEVGEEIEYFFEKPHYSKELLNWKDKQTPENILRHLNALHVIFSRMDDNEWEKEAIEKEIMPHANKEGRGEVLWPLRVSLSGRRASAGPFEISGVLGKSETLSRIQNAIKLLS